MIIRLIILVLLSVGLAIGQMNIDDGTTAIDTNSIWQDYEHEQGVILPEPIVKGMMFVFSMIVNMGINMAEWVDPYGYVLAIIVLFFGIIHLHWLLYPILFIYVLRDERKKARKEKEITNE
jgi:predicted PurR-regulated permease PerM